MDKHGGRVEVRTLTATTLLNEDLDWPGVAQVGRVEREVRRVGKAPRRKVDDAITSVPPGRAPDEDRIRAAEPRGQVLLVTVEPKMHADGIVAEP